MEQIASKVEKQELEIAYIKKSIDEILKQNEEQFNQLKKISESIAKQELILEKISNLEFKYNDGIKRVHQRLDYEFGECKKNVAMNTNEITKIKESLLNRECPKYELTKKELELVNAQIQKHAKIFWWLGTLVLGAIVLAIIHAHIK